MAELNNLRQLFRYDLWANKRTIEAADGHLFEESQQCLDMLAHVIAAQKIWYTRIQGTSAGDLELWPQNTYADGILKDATGMHSKWIALLDENADTPDRIISYSSTKGTSFDTPLAGILHHVIIHGQHHRAQIASKLREGGAEPPATDFIYYLRLNEQK